jgi:hypothetical protein
MCSNSLIVLIVQAHLGVTSKILGLTCHTYNLSGLTTRFNIAFSPILLLFIWHLLLSIVKKVSPANQLVFPQWIWTIQPWHTRLIPLIVIQYYNLNIARNGF